jgi:hypothetical protein
MLVQKILLLSLFISFPAFGMENDTAKKLLEQNSQPVQAAQDFKCAICWEPKPGNHFWKLPNCTHSFCVECVVKSAKVNNVACALCRKPWVLGGAGNELPGPVPDAERAALKTALGITAIILFGGGYAFYRLDEFGTFCSLLLTIFMSHINLIRR